MLPLRAGPFALIDAGGLGLTDIEYCTLLADRYRVALTPVSDFPSGQQQALETRIRVALSRSWRTIEALAVALNDSAGKLA